MSEPCLPCLNLVCHVSTLSAMSQPCLPCLNLVCLVEWSIDENFSELAGERTMADVRHLECTIPELKQVQTRLPTCLPTCLPTRLPTRLPTCLPTRLPTHLPTRLPTCLTTTNSHGKDRPMTVYGIAPPPLCCVIALPSLCCVITSHPLIPCNDILM